MAFQKTQEEIEEERRLFAERYPEASPESDVDPTQASRDSLMRGIGNILPKNSPINQSIGQDLRNAGIPKPEYEMPADLKEHAYDIFPSLNEIAPRSSVEIPFAPKEQFRAPATLEAPEVEIPEQSGIMDSLDKEPEATQGGSPAQEPSSAPAQVAPQDDIAAMIEASSENAKNARLAGNMAKVRDAAIGAGLGTEFKHDDSMYKQMAADADAPIKKFLLAGELNNTKAKNDPNSEISKLVRGSLKQMGVSMDGLDGVSYAQIEKIYPSLTNSIMTKYANDAKREERNLMRNFKADAKASADLDRVGASIDRQMAQFRISAPAKSYDSAKTAEALIRGAIGSTNPLSKIDAAAAFMNYAKSAQGDDSVVKAEDMKVLTGGWGFNGYDEMINKLGSKVKGKQFSDGELSAMARVVATIKNIKRAKLQQYLTPIRYKADMAGYDLNQNVTPEYLEEIFAPMPLSRDQKLQRRGELEAKVLEAKELEAKQGK